MLVTSQVTEHVFKTSRVLVLNEIVATRLLH